MGLVLTEKYSHFFSYFTNRLLRLYPAYFVVIAATLAHSLLRWALGRTAGDPGLLDETPHGLG